MKTFRLLGFWLMAVCGGLVRAASTPADTDASAVADEKPRMEVAFVLDTTGSMGGMIAGAKRKIWAIANKLKSAEPTPEIRFGLVAFRDRQDAFVTAVTPLSEQLDDIHQALYSFQADGGGDSPEAVNEALHCAVRDLQWSDSPKVLRVIFLVGDAPPHMDYVDDVKYPESCHLAKAKGILVNTLQCGQNSDTEKVWREIARLTGGSYAALQQDGGSVRLDTPHDAEIVRLSLALDATIVAYGTPAERENVWRNRALLARMSAEGVADRASFLGKSEAGAVMPGKGDLVLEIMSDRFSLDAIDPRKLEGKLQNMFAEERNAQILRLVEERRALHRQLAAVVKQRDAAVAEKLAALKGQDTALELSAFHVLETQAARSGFRFDAPLEKAGGATAKETSAKESTSSPRPRP